MIALVFEQHVEVEGVLGAEVVHLHRVIDDEIDRHKRVDLLRIATEPGHRCAHRGDIDQHRHAGKVLQDHARRHKRQLDLGGLFGIPGRDAANVVFGDGKAIAVAQQRLAQHANRKRQTVKVRV